MSKICFVVYDLSIVGGVERVVESLSNKLSENGFDVYVVSLHGKDINPAFRFNKGIKIDYVRLKEERLRKQMIEGVRKLLRYFNNNKIDIAFLEATYSGFIGAPINYLTKTRIVFCDHGALRNQLGEKDVRIMRRIASLMSNMTVALTKKSAEDYMNIFRIKEKRITYIYNWINNAYIDKNRQYDLNSKVILSVGRLTKEKGFDLLIEVAKKVFVRNKDKEWKWYIYGEGPLEGEISEAIIKNGLEDFIFLKGFTDDVPSIYQHAAIYVLPSYREGLPLVLLEAKAFKIPTISFDICTGPDEIIIDGVNGYLIKPYDSDAMADRVLELIGNDSLRQRFSANTYTNIEQFREDIVFKQWLKLIRDLS